MKDRCARSRCKNPAAKIKGGTTTLCLAHAVKAGTLKYRNRPGISPMTGRRFDSQAERRRGEELTMLEKAGGIRNLRFQVSVPLIVNGKTVTTWRADFVYEEMPRDRSCWLITYEDVKGFRTEVYNLKAKLFEALFGFPIKETGTQRKGKKP